MSRQVFICYHPSDSETVLKLRDDLSKRGVATWLDQYDIKPGQSKQAATYSGIINSDIFAACLSPNFLKAGFCRIQTFLARAYGKKIIPIIMANFPNEGLPIAALLEAGRSHNYAFKGLEELQWLDFRQSGQYLASSYEDEFANLVDAIQPIPKPSPLNAAPIYITYSRHDKVFARRLAKDLELAGGRVLIDVFFIRAGDNWREAIYHNLRLASCLVVCISPEAAGSENVMHEVLLSKIRELPCYPVVSERVHQDAELSGRLASDLEASPEMRFLNDYQWFTPEPSYQALLKSLKIALNLDEAAKPAKNGIFISYRRADSQAITGRIQEKLVERFGAETVFMDVDSIPPGEDFAEYYKTWLTDRAATVLIMIGEKWTSLTDPASADSPRLFQAGDHVRIEAETALNLEDLQVIPVLVGEARMPSPQDLPDSLRGLTRLNACRVRHNPDFSSDMGRLIAALESLPVMSEDA